ncbi:protein ERGIC-53-like isoform X1 [Mytilus galloprovincialis]|uniref:protein ERGIC-53-like isoform X1 n=1 Tax=Mytilus galloprovincialis TaxID=29158 RepID=UPI003F7C3916
MVARLFLLFLFCFVINAANLKPRFEYKYSFKGPHLVQSDNSIPFWEYGGDAIASADNIRITPSLRSKKGWAWTKNPITFDQWSVECVFKVTGRGRIGADGLAVWYTTQKSQEGTVYGSTDMWNGLGVFMDSFDNDGQHNNPYVMAMVNDGTKQYDHQSDGSQQQIGGCMRDFRNKPYPVRVKVEYYNRILTVFINTGLTNNKDDFELCLRQENVDLPKGGYFGISAATGGLADDHDVLAFLTHSLHDGDQLAAKTQVSEQERQKYENEFDNYYKELEKNKQDFNEAHPDKVRQDYEGEFDNQGERELRMIFEGQNSIHHAVKELRKTLDELLGRQEMVLTRVSQLSTGGAVQAPQGGAQQQMGGGGGVPMLDTIKRHEVDRVMNNQNDLMQSAREMRQLLNDIQNRANVIQQNMGQGGGAAGGGGGGGLPQHTQQAISELQEHMKYVRQDVVNLVNRPQSAGGVACPPPLAVSCITPTLFFVSIIAQFVLLIAYMVYRSNKEAQAKKFY